MFEDAAAIQMQCKIQELHIEIAHLAAEHAAVDVREGLMAPLEHLQTNIKETFSETYNGHFSFNMQEPDQTVLSHMLEAVSDIVEVVKAALLSLEQLGQAFQRFKVVLDSSKQRRQERLQRQHAEDFDEDEADAIEVGSPSQLWPN